MAPPHPSFSGLWGWDAGLWSFCLPSQKNVLSEAQGGLWVPPLFYLGRFAYIMSLSPLPLP